MSIQKFVNASMVGTALVILTACGGDSGSATTATTPPSSQTPPPTVSDFPTKLSTSADVGTFISLAGFGATGDELSDLPDTDAADWLQSQMSMRQTRYLPTLKTIIENGSVVDDHQHRSLYWDAMVEAPDQLRQRMVFALSQILVVSDEDVDGPLAMAYYMDLLSDNAFGNYRDLLEDITYSPAMADYLTYLRNRKGNESKGRTPDENYARELLQLFTIGLVELNPDGTVKLDAQGQEIETYTNDDIIGLARVFTGLGLDGGSFGSRDDALKYVPLAVYPDQHSELEKSFLGQTISAGTGAEDSIAQALDHIFDHPNVGPFISRQLIQRFTASHPSPEYVQRVATVFDAGRFEAPNGDVFGTGRRGDLAATIAAILLDTDILTDNGLTLPGKVREPALRWAHWARAFKIKNVNARNERLLRDSSNIDELAQQPFSSPSVFNFYRPGYVAPGTATASQNMTAPEFQIVNDSTTTGYINFMSDFILDRSGRYNDGINTFEPDYSDEMALANDPAGLIDHLDDLLLMGRMADQTRERIGIVLDEIPIREAAEDAEADKFARVAVAITMSIADPAFTIQYGGTP